MAKRDTALSRALGIGLAWNVIIHWLRQDVLDYIHHCGGGLHKAYRIYGSSRVSRALCMLASRGDLRAAASCDENAAVYRELVHLEVRSTFSFPSGNGLGDVAPGLLEPALRARLAETRERAALRQAAEAEILAHLLDQAGWPVCSRPWLKRGVSPRCADVSRRPWASPWTVWMPMLSLPGTRS